MERINLTLKTAILSTIAFFMSTALVAQTCLIDWSYKRPITIDNSGGEALTDYQLLLILDTESAISVGRMEPDGSDIRFTNDECCEQLCYYIESGINTATTAIWVNVPEIPAGGTYTINYFHGNPEAEASSDASCTFAFWEGFDDPEMNFEYLCGTIADTTISGGNLNFGWTSSGLLGSTETFPFGEVYTAEAQVNSASGTWPAIYWAKTSSQKSYGLMINSTDARISVTGGGTGWCSGHNWASPLVPYTDPAGLWSMTWIATGDIIADFPTVGALSSTSTLYAKDEDLRLNIGGISSGTGTLNIDWIRVRKYTATPPTYSVGTPVPFSPAPLFDLGSDVEDCGMATLDAGPGFDLYEWSTGGVEQTEDVTTSGTYQITVTDSEECFQIDSVDVTIFPSFESSESFDVCPGTAYTFPDGSTEADITATVIHTSNLTTEHGCDSIIETTINVYEIDPILDLGSDIMTCDDSAFLDAGEGFASYSWDGGSTNQIDTVTTSGIYTVTVLDDNGCEQVDEIDVEFIIINTALTVDGETLTSEETEASAYQWLDCSDEFAPVPGETMISYTATFNSHFAVEITKDGCVDTTECININSVSITDIDGQEVFSIFPNPTPDNITIQAEGNFTYQVTTLGGEILLNGSASFNEIISLKEQANGIYLIKVTIDDNTYISKVVKQ